MTRPISLIALAAILALVLAWLSTILRWSSGTLSVDQSRVEAAYRFVPQDSRGDRILRVSALALFVTAGMLNALASKRPHLPAPAALLLVAMLMYCTFWYVISYKTSEYWPGLIGITSPLLFTMCLGVFAGFDPTLWRWLRPVALMICYVSIVLACFYTLRYSIKGSFEGPNPTVEHLQVAFWFALCLLILRRSSRWRDCLGSFVGLGACVPVAVIIGSRSLTLLAITGLVAGLMIPLHHYFKRSLVRVFSLCILTAGILGLVFWLLSLGAPDRIESFKGRLREDTRSSQYTQFFQQVPLSSLISGMGPKATYSYNDRANYDFIDNQFLYILFKFGLPVMAGYCAVVLWPGLRLLGRPRNDPYWLTGLVFGFWTLATLGLSIFHSILVNPQNLMIILLAGSAWAAWQPRTISVPAGRQALMLRPAGIFARHTPDKPGKPGILLPSMPQGLERRGQTRAWRS